MRRASLRVALVHDQLADFGGAERLLLVLGEMYPAAPIFTAFYRKNSPAYQYFKDADIRPSFAQKIPGFTGKLYSPMRFLAPLIWESFDFSGYDLVISSASWFITKGILTRPETLHICYCHTPPRYLWGLPTSVVWQRYWPVRLYGSWINGWLREYDWLAAQRPDIMIANSKNTQGRIKKFYGRESQVIYPPVELMRQRTENKKQPAAARDYFLTVSRVVGGKGLELAVRACSELGLALKVVGAPTGWSGEARRLRKLAGPTVEFMGWVDDAQLVDLYAGAKAFLATAQDEDFGMTVVEAMLAGTPVIAYRGGGYTETVKEGESGLFFDEYSTEGLEKVLENFSGKAGSRFAGQKIVKQAQRFSKERFVRDITRVINQAFKKSPVL